MPEIGLYDWGIYQEENRFYLIKLVLSKMAWFDSHNLHSKALFTLHSKFDLKIKEVLHNDLRKPKLNEKQNYFAVTLSL